MANITDQFVTSFSELYIGAKGTTDYTASGAVKNFFTGGGLLSAAEEVTLGSANTITTGQVIYVADSGNKIFFSTVGITAIADTVTTLDELVALAAVNFLVAQVPLVMEIGTLSNEATVIDTPTFGEVFKGKLRGQLDGGQLDTQLYWAPRNFVHKLMRDYAQDGTEIVAGIKWKNQSGTGGDSEYVVFDSFVSSFGIDTTFDDVAKASTTLVVDGAEHFEGDA